jgi:hypothetical protein
MMVVGVGAQARGESAGTTAPINAVARQALDDAREAEASGRKREAIQGYKRAYELSGDPTLLFQLGELSREVGDTSAAVRFYRAYLARDRHGKNRAAAERAVSSLDSEDVREDVGPATTARPTSPPPSPAPAQDAFLPAAPPARPATAATAPAGTEVGTASARPSPTVALQVPAGPTTTAAARAVTPSDPPLPRWLPWAGLGVTVALGAGAMYSGLRASRRYDELSNSCGQTSAGCAQTDIDQVKAQALAANLLWAAAGVGALTTGVMVYVNTRESGVSGVWRF